jgi:hypothetical protein
MKIEIPDVTLICVDTTPRIEGSFNAIYTSISGINFGAIKLISTKEMVDKYEKQLSDDGIQIEEVVCEVNCLDDYSKYCIYNLTEHIQTSHCITVQWDGFVLNPDKWDSSWLEYDYIGAPWEYSNQSYIDPFGNHQRVGNGGFSLRSKKLLDVPKYAYIHFDVNWGDFYKHMNANNFAEDGNICVHNRHIYEALGCKFAPVEVAARFSQEKKVPESVGIMPFGFHHNLPEGIELV